MSNTSATGGLLVAVSDPRDEGAQEDAVHNLIAALAGLDTKMVRPRWQPNQPKQPPLSVPWCAFGLQTVTPEENAYEEHRPDGRHLVSQHEEIEALLSFFGPDAGKKAKLVRLGIQLAQNREGLRAVGLVLAHVGPTRRVPTLVGETWLERRDLEIAFRSMEQLEYSVGDIASARSVLLTDIEAIGSSGVLTDSTLDGVLTDTESDGVLADPGSYQLHRHINVTP